MWNWINIALPKGRLGEKAYDIFEAIGYGCPSIHEGGRKLIFENEENGVRYFWVKPSDVAVYVERGAAAIGVAAVIIAVVTVLRIRSRRRKKRLFKEMPVEDEEDDA